jgi:hypothetical protein
MKRRKLFFHVFSGAFNPLGPVSIRCSQVAFELLAADMYMSVSGRQLTGHIERDRDCDRDGSNKGVQLGECSRSSGGYRLRCFVAQLHTCSSLACWIKLH